MYWIYDNINNIWYEKIWDVVPLRMNNPVVNITWYEARAYCKWKGYRLLKESEWEYLAQLSNNINFSNLGMNKCSLLDENNHSIQVFADRTEGCIVSQERCKSSSLLTQICDLSYPVKRDLSHGISHKHTISVLKEANINSYGIVGLCENCWEWCDDTFYPYDGFVKDIINPQMSYPLFGKTKVCRGGSWASSIVSSYYRKPIEPESFIEYTGFRVAI